MISTGREGRAVAVVLGGKHEGTVIRISMSAAEAETPKRPMHEVLDESDFIIDPRKFRKLPLDEQLRIAIALQESDEEDPEEEQKKMLQRRITAAYKARSSTEYRLDDGKMVVLPSRETERVFVAGKSGAGKSCWAASYMREYSEMFPDRKIYLFSTHEDEKAYEEIEHTAIPLGEEFIESPPTLEALENTLCLFDDTDNLQNKKLLKAVDAVNADLISNGRKYNIHVVTLNHQLMEHSRTRNQLNEANRVVFFPQGSAYHTQRYLKVYAGLDGKWVKKILDERSRWICLDLRLPTSYVTENAVVIIKSLDASPPVEYSEGTPPELKYRRPQA
jgi:hypothetical protein